MGDLQKSGSLLAKPTPSDGNRLWKVSTAPTIEPISVLDVKEFARIDGNDEDSVLEDFIVAVRQNAEDYLRRALITQSIQMVMDFWPSGVIELPRPPLISITKVATLDEDDVETEYSSTNYYSINESVPGKLVIKNGSAAPTNSDRYHGGFLIEYKAGYGNYSGAIPANIRLALKQWVTSVYENRTIDPRKPPPEARPLLDLFRVLKF
jgi:uncharacterized phiE125 gp8 family phage protein